MNGTATSGKDLTDSWRDGGYQNFDEFFKAETFSFRIISGQNYGENLQVDHALQAFPAVV